MMNQPQLIFCGSYHEFFSVLGFTIQKIPGTRNIISTTATVASQINNHKPEDNFELTQTYIHILHIYICITKIVISRNFQAPYRQAY